MNTECVAWFDAEEWEKDYLEKLEYGFEAEFFDEKLTKENTEKLREEFDAVSVFVSSELDAETLRNLDVDTIACRSTGFDHVDIDTAEEEGIKVCNVPEYGSNTVAEHTFGLILTLSRRIKEAAEKVEQGEFSHEGLKGFDLEGKTLGVIGTGSIGQEVIRIAEGFNMNIVASDPYPDKKLESEMPFMYVSRKDLLEISDIVTLHCPLMDENRHMISEKEFEIMNGSILVNTSRGGLVDTEALLKALNNGNISRAGLDVLEEEGFIQEDIELLGSSELDPEKVMEDHILMQRDDVVVTPHNAFNSKEALERIVRKTVENLEEGKNFVN